MEKQALLNTYINNLTMQETVEAIEQMIAANKKSYVVAINVDVVMKIEEDPYLKKVVDNADMVLVDGKPLVWISKLHGKPLKAKISGSDLVPLLCEVAAQKGYKIFIIGGKDGIADQAKQRLEVKLPGIKIVGTYAPPFGFEKNVTELDKINQMISESSPDLLIACFGCPKQEKWIYENIAKYEAKVSICAGATVDFLAGNVKRAPRWMSEHGLEWFYRFLQEPKRMFKRYFVDDVKIVKLVRKCEYMILSEQKILFFTRTMKLGGTENVVLQLCEILKPLVKKIVVCSCGGVNVEKLSDMGIKHYSIPDIEEKSINTIINVSATLKSIIKKEKITVIHTHHRMAAFYVAFLGLYRECYFVNTCHNTFTDKKGLTRFAYKHANLIACGNMVKNNLSEFFSLPNEQITVIHNAVKPFNELRKEDPLIKELHQNGYFVIGNVGRLSEQKGMEYYIRAIPSIAVEHPEARFLIIGSGEDEEKLRSLSRDLGIEDLVLFTGYRSEIQNIMSQLDLVVLSSLWEGLPLTPIEAFSVGKTIVATAVDGTVEIVEDKINGLLVEAKHSEQIADRVKYMMENPSEKKQMEANAYLRYITEYSFSNLAEAYIKYYESMER